MPNMRNNWKPQLLNDKLQVGSTSQDEVLRAPDIKEPAANSKSTDESPESCDRNQQSIAGQEEVKETDEVKHEEPPELTASEDDTSDGPGSERNENAGRGPGDPLTHVAAPEDIAADDFKTTA